MYKETAFDESREMDPPHHYNASKTSPDAKSHTVAPTKTQPEQQEKSEQLKTDAWSTGSPERKSMDWRKILLGFVTGLILAALLETYWWGPRRPCAPQK